MTKAIRALLVAVVAAAPMPVANADGLSMCTEDHATLESHAHQTISAIAARVPLGPNENSGTVLQFVQKALSGTNGPMSCTQIMDLYATGRIDGTFKAPPQ